MTDGKNTLTFDSYIEYVDEYNKKQSYFVWKRIIDVVGALIGIVVAAIPCLIFMILIKLESKGPALYIHKRVGKNGREFNMYKLRSMTVDADKKLKFIIDQNETTGPMFKMKEDPRVTRIGKFIRKTSIDELPQLVNVLKGDMSLVGPRPSLPHEVKEFSDYQKLRLMATPGLTCYWQVNGRSNIGFDEWMEMDIQYCRDRCTLLDIKLILKTFRVFLGDKNAC